MAEPVTELFARAERAGDPLPPPEITAVRERGRRIRRHRRLLAGTAAACAVLGATGAVRVLATAGDDARTAGVTTAATSAGRRGGTTATVAATVPSSTTRGRSPDGLLELEDLGAGGWTRSDAEGGPSEPVDHPGCDATTRTVTGAGHRQVYRGSTPEGAEWLVDEQAIPVDAATSTAVGALLRATASGCRKVSGDVVLAADGTFLITGTLLPEGSVGYAHGYALGRGSYVSVDTLPGGAIGQIPLPGQADWMIAVTAAALERATGVRPAAPTPNEAARSAAARYSPPSQVVHVASPGVGAITTMPPPTGVTVDVPNDATVPAPTATGTPPAGYLALADLGTTGGWTVNPADRGDWQTSSSQPVDLPACGAVKRQVEGAGGTLTYRGTTSGGSGEWILAESVVRLTSNETAAARAAITAAATCSPVGDQFGTGQRAQASATSVVVVNPLGNGSPGFAEGWAIRGDVLVQLVTLPGGAAGNALLPGGSAWLNALLTKAVQRAAK